MMESVVTEDEQFEKQRYARFNDRGGNQHTDRAHRFTETKKRCDTAAEDRKNAPKQLRLKYAPDMYSATFFSLSMEYKWRYNLC
jgi:hypothetical protein